LDKLISNLVLLVEVLNMCDLSAKYSNPILFICELGAYKGAGVAQAV
jgi:hypothetical protein